MIEELNGRRLCAACEHVQFTCTKHKILVDPQHGSATCVECGRTNSMVPTIREQLEKWYPYWAEIKREDTTLKSANGKILKMGYPREHVVKSTITMAKRCIEILNMEIDGRKLLDISLDSSMSVITRRSLRKLKKVQPYQKMLRKKEDEEGVIPVKQRTKIFSDSYIKALIGIFRKIRPEWLIEYADQSLEEYEEAVGQALHIEDEDERKAALERAERIPHVVYEDYEEPTFEIQTIPYQDPEPVAWRNFARYYATTRGIERMFIRLSAELGTRTRDTLSLKWSDIIRNCEQSKSGRAIGYRDSKTQTYGVHGISNELYDLLMVYREATFRSGSHTQDDKRFHRGHENDPYILGGFPIEGKDPARPESWKPGLHTEIVKKVGLALKYAGVTEKRTDQKTVYAFRGGRGSEVRYRYGRDAMDYILHHSDSTSVDSRYSNPVYVNIEPTRLLDITNYQDYIPSELEDMINANNKRNGFTEKLRLERRRMMSRRNTSKRRQKEMTKKAEAIRDELKELGVICAVPKTCDRTALSEMRALRVKARRSRKVTENRLARLCKKLSAANIKYELKSKDQAAVKYMQSLWSQYAADTRRCRDSIRNYRTKLADMGLVFETADNSRATLFAIKEFFKAAVKKRREEEKTGRN